jgi:hypothetical protein
MYFPTFLVVAPHTNGVAASVFKNPQRNYETMKIWLMDVIGDKMQLVTNDTKVLEEMDSKVLAKMWDEMQAILSDRQIRDSDT